MVLQRRGTAPVVGRQTHHQVHDPHAQAGLVDERAQVDEIEAREPLRERLRLLHDRVGHAAAAECVRRGEHAQQPLERLGTP